MRKNESSKLILNSEKKKTCNNAKYFAVFYSADSYLVWKTVLDQGKGLWVYAPSFVIIENKAY